MWWVCGYLSEYFRHQWMRRSYLKSWYVSSFYEKSFWSVFIYLWHLLPLQYICFVFTTFPSLRHLVSWEQDIMIYIVSRRNDRIRKAASRGMPLCGAWPKLTMKWPLIKGQARPDPETHKWRKLLWPLLPPPLYQINQFGLPAVHPFDACYQKLK